MANLWDDEANWVTTSQILAKHGGTPYRLTKFYFSEASIYMRIY